MRSAYCWALDGEAAQEAHRHVPLQALGSHLSLGRRDDARGEEDEVELLGRERAPDAAALGHEAQVRLEEVDARRALVTEGAPDDGDGRAARGQLACELAPEAVGAADDHGLAARQRELGGGNDVEV